MALTASLIVRANAGSQQKLVYRFTPDAAATSFTAPLNAIQDIAVAYQSATTGGVKFAMNEGVAGTSIGGSLAMTGCTSGDEYIVAIYGPA